MPEKPGELEQSSQAMMKTEEEVTSLSLHTISVTLKSNFFCCLWRAHGFNLF